MVGLKGGDGCVAGVGKREEGEGGSIASPAVCGDRSSRRYAEIVVHREERQGGVTLHELETIDE
jgi:hypothetical protein